MRNQLLCGYPDEVRLKKIAAHSVMLSQCGLYNYQRCIDRGERGAAELYSNSFVRHAIALVYLLNNKYQPFDKWVYRRMRELTVLPELEVTLSSLSEIGNAQKEAKTKLEIFSDICTLFKSTLASLGIAREDHPDIEEAAFEIQNSIKNTEIRNMHIMAGI